jgi:hypothetical protein
MKLYNRQFAPKPRRVGMMVLEKGLNLPAIEEVIGDGLRLAPSYIQTWPQRVAAARTRPSLARR